MEPFFLILSHPSSHFYPLISVPLATVLLLSSWLTNARQFFTSECFLPAFLHADYSAHGVLMRRGRPIDAFIKQTTFSIRHCIHCKVRKTLTGERG
jgi:hypothetical protein